MITPSKPVQPTEEGTAEETVDKSQALADKRLGNGQLPTQRELDALASRGGIDSQLADVEKSFSRTASAGPGREQSSAAAMEIAGSCLGFRLRLLDRVVARIYDDALRPLELRRTQLDLLAALHRFGPASPARLISMLGLEKSSLSRNIRRLITRGVVAELPGSDRRCHLLELTDAGHAQLADALPAWRRAQAEVDELLGHEAGESIRSMARHYWRTVQSSADNE